MCDFMDGRIIDMGNIEKLETEMKRKWIKW